MPCDREGGIWQYLVSSSFFFPLLFLCQGERGAFYNPLSPPPFFFPPLRFLCQGEEHLIIPCLLLKGTAPTRAVPSGFFFSDGGTCVCVWMCVCVCVCLSMCVYNLYISIHTCVCVCKCICVWIHTRVHVCGYWIHIHTYLYTRVFVCVWERESMCVNNLYISIHTYIIYTYLYTRECVCVCVCVCEYVCKYPYISIHMFTATLVHTFFFLQQKGDQPPIEPGSSLLNTVFVYFFFCSRGTWPGSDRARLFFTNLLPC